MLSIPLRFITQVPFRRRVLTSFTAVSRLTTMSTTQWIPNQYPNARRSDHLDIYKSATKGEVRVADPYQWLEEDTPETDKWTTAQEAFTRTYLDKNPDLKSLEDAFTNVNNYPKVLNFPLSCTAFVPLLNV